MKQNSHDFRTFLPEWKNRHPFATKTDVLFAEFLCESGIGGRTVDILLKCLHNPRFNTKELSFAGFRDVRTSVAEYRENLSKKRSDAAHPIHVVMACVSTFLGDCSASYDLSREAREIFNVQRTLKNIALSHPLWTGHALRVFQRTTYISLSPVQNVEGM